MRKVLIVGGVVAILFLIQLSYFSVDASEYAYVIRLGQHVATLDGAAADGAGLHAGLPWPFQLVTRLDRRLQYFDLPGIELLTHDPEGKTIDKTLTVEAYVCWRIAGAEAVDRFIKNMGNAEQARDFLGQRIINQIGAAISDMKMDDLISTAPGRDPSKTRVDETMETLQSRLVQNLRGLADKEYGIELVDIRLRRFNHPAQVRDAIFERIRSERNKKVADYQSQGEKQAKDIETRAEEKKRALLAQARYEEEKLKGEADTEAMKIRNQAHSQDPEFYAFLKKLEKLQNILGDNKTVLLLSSHRQLFDLLYEPPRPNGTSGVKNGSTPAGNGSRKSDPDPKTGGPK
jgi:membrane protease subunit HflC